METKLYRHNGGRRERKNLGVGWDKKAKKMKDLGRVVISKKEEDTGAFKTPGLRETTKHAPYRPHAPELGWARLYLPGI